MGGGLYTWGINSLSFILSCSERIPLQYSFIPPGILMEPLLTHCMFRTSRLTTTCSLLLLTLSLASSWCLGWQGMERDHTERRSIPHCSSWVPSATKWSMQVAEASTLQQKPTSLPPKLISHHHTENISDAELARKSIIIVAGDPSGKHNCPLESKSDKLITFVDSRLLLA